jgi:metal-responsive CopG/Arc/MetJ family transcriptional regulator
VEKVLPYLKPDIVARWIQSIDEFSGGQKNRSELIERALRDYLDRQARLKRDLQDLVILNKKGDKLNREAADVLSYQSCGFSQAGQNA